MFLGYPPDKPGHRAQEFGRMREMAAISPTTYIMYMAPFKLARSLAEMKEALGDVEVVLARELTKIHQEVKKQAISEWLTKFKKQKPRGEYVCLVHLPQ